MFEKDNQGDNSSHSILRSIVFRLVKKHIAGSTLSSALQQVREHNQNGMHATVTLLNEHVDDANKARYNTNSYLQFIKQVSRLQMNAGVSVRLSQLGYNIDKQVLEKSLISVLDEAESRKVPIWLEYEKGIKLQELFDVYRRYRQNCKLLGVELPVLHPVDSNEIKSLVKKNDNIKLVTYSFASNNGNGNGKSRKARGKKKEKDDEEHYSANPFEMYIAKIGRLLQSDANVHVLEPDEKLISKIAGFSKEYKKDLIFELPLGFNEKKVRKLSKAKVRMGVYLPYGKDWAPYVVNKLAEGRTRKLAAKMLKEKQ